MRSTRTRARPSLIVLWVVILATPAVLALGTFLFYVTVLSVGD
jgi:hypothetical protein